MPSKIIILISLSIILASTCIAKDIPSMLSDAKKLKYAEKLNKEVDALIVKAISKIERGLNPERVYLDTERELFDMQKSANQSWKGHGPEILKPAMEKLINYYDEKELPDPSDPLLLSISASPEVTQEGEVSELTVTIKNRSSLPIILIDFQFEGLDYLTFAWQKSMRGDLSYDGTKDVFVYNPLAQQETYHHFNLGLLFPGQTTTFHKTARIPEPKPTAYLRFVPVSSYDLKNIYSTTDSTIYSQADIFELQRNAPVEITLSDKNTFPGKGTIIFDTEESIIRMQSFTLDLGPK
ncbi:MAG: hypothetical protein U9R38_06535 [Candidatus Margulisiibacteriota bacterium]|nr:hypothetical protein [Candidatus Margulisiibacteriota bacterium]